MTIRVALVNDDEIVVRGLDAMFRQYGDRIRVVELDARRQVAAECDIALYDTFGQTQGNSEAVQRLVANPRVAKVAVYTWNFQPWLAEQAIAMGVSGYLSKALRAGHLVDALAAVHAGRVIVSPTPGPRATVVGGDWPGREEGLTAREAEVLSLITAGLSNLEIAEHTSLSVNSIKSYIRSAYRKIDVDSRSKAVLWGVEHGMRADRMRVSRPS